MKDMGNIYGLGRKSDEAEIADACPSFCLTLKEADGSRYGNRWLFGIMGSQRKTLKLSRGLAVMETKGPLCSAVWSVVGNVPCPLCGTQGAMIRMSLVLRRGVGMKG